MTKTKTPAVAPEAAPTEAVETTAAPMGLEVSTNFSLEDNTAAPAEPTEREVTATEMELIGGLSLVSYE